MKALHFINIGAAVKLREAKWFGIRTKSSIDVNKKVKQKNSCQLTF